MNKKKIYEVLSKYLNNVPMSQGNADKMVGELVEVCEARVELKALKTELAKTFDTLADKRDEVKQLRSQLAAKDVALRDMYALACELGEDDGFYFEQRNGMERVANAAQALKESEQE